MLSLTSKTLCVPSILSGAFSFFFSFCLVNSFSFFSSLLKHDLLFDLCLPSTSFHRAPVLIPTQPIFLFYNFFYLFIHFVINLFCKSEQVLFPQYQTKGLEETQIPLSLYLPLTVFIKHLVCVKHSATSWSQRLDRSCLVLN